MGKRVNWTTCKQTGKRRFRTKDDAETALRQSLKLQQNRWHGGDRAEKRYYSCEFCDGYHLTRQPYSRAGFDDAMEQLRLETLKSLEMPPSILGQVPSGPAAGADTLG
jgi:hypothetical protein